MTVQFPLLIKCLLLFGIAAAPGQQSANVPTANEITSHPIVMDVTVFDRLGVPVTSGLEPKNFHVTQGDQAAAITFLVSPKNNGQDGDAVTASSRTIILQDLLNADAADASAAFNAIHSVLSSQPNHLSSPTEILTLSDTGLKVNSGFTQDREALLAALSTGPTTPSWKATNEAFAEDRYRGTITALREIALQNRGSTIHTNVIWVGRGGPNLDTRRMAMSALDPLLHEAHETANLLVHARTALYLIYPSFSVLPAGRGAMPRRAADAQITEMAANANFGSGDPFRAFLNFGVYVNLTGGAVFADRNDVAAQIVKALLMGSTFYTFIYEPAEGTMVPGFQRVRISLENPGWKVTGPTGYFVPDLKAQSVLRKDTISELTEAMRSNLPYNTLSVSLTRIIQHPDSDSAEFKVQLNLGNLAWEKKDNTDSSTSYRVAIASLGEHREVLRSRLETLSTTVPTQDRRRLDREMTLVAETIKMPKGTRSVRILVEDVGSGRIGAIEANLTSISAAPQIPTPLPRLIPRS